MASPLEVVMLLADHAVAEPGTGKVHMLGAGWSMVATPTPPQAVVAILHIPWDRTNQRIPITIKLLDGDGQAVVLPVPAGETEEVSVSSEVEVGRPAGLPPGTPVVAAIALNIQSMPLQPGRYEWVLDAAAEIFRTSFTVIRTPQVTRP